MTDRTSDDLADGRRSYNIEAYRDIELPQLDPAHWRPSPFGTPSTQYEPVMERPESDSDAEPLKPQEYQELQDQHHLHHWESEKPSPWKTGLIQTSAVLWLVPIVALLILNLKDYIIGASAWCPFGHCKPRVYSSLNKNDDGSDALYLPARFERETRNLLGTLQFAAKALEVWFILIASWLVYLLTTRVAALKAGLPMGYITRPSEFDKIPSLWDPLLWSTLRRLPPSRPTARHARKRIWMFIAFTIFLCALCNLMGPAVAVLILPTLQWIDTGLYDTIVFTNMNSNRPPGTEGFAMGNEGNCDDIEIEAQDFSCAIGFKGSLNAWVENYGQAYQDANVVGLQSDITFSYNHSYSMLEDNTAGTANTTFETLTWIPNRQVLFNFSWDTYLSSQMSAGKQMTDLLEMEVPATLAAKFDTYSEYNNTVQTEIRRNGPLLGALAGVWAGYHDDNRWTTYVDADRSVQCYANYNLSSTPFCWGSCTFRQASPVAGNYTRCIPVGSGWNMGYKKANFLIERVWREWDGGYFQPPIYFNVHASERAAFLPNGNLPDGFEPECLAPNGTLSSDQASACKWDLLWDTGDEPAVAHRSRDVNTIEMSLESHWKEGYPYHIEIVVDYVAYLAQANYTLDPSKISNPLKTADWMLNVSNEVSVYEQTRIAVDPAWTLAAWAVDAGGNVTATNSIASSTLDVFDHFYTAFNDSQPIDVTLNGYESGRLNKIGLLPILQTLSLIDFNSTTTQSTEPINEPGKTLLYRTARVYVWMYGISGRRTSYVGIVVAIMGCLVVLAEVVLGFQDRRRFRSLTQWLVAALEHPYQREFDEWRGDEKNISRVSFRISNDSSTVGKFKYEKVS